MVRKIFYVIVLVFFLAIAALVVFSYLYKDEIIDGFIAEANRSIDTPIEVAEFDFTLFEDFPNLSVSLHEIIIMESSGDHREKLAEAEKVYFHLNLWQLIQGNYTIDEVAIHNGTVGLKVFEDGTNNYKVIKANRDSTSGSGIVIDINSIRLEEVDISYELEKTSELYDIYARSVKAKWSTDEISHSIDLNGSMRLDSLRRGGISYGKRELEVDGALSLFHKNRDIAIHSALATFEGSEYEVRGEIKKGFIDIAIESKSTQLESLVKLLPEESSRILSKYRSRGDLYFSAGFDQKDSGPIGLKMDFGSDNASIFYPGYGKTLEKLKSRGSFRMGDVNNVKTGSVKLSEFRGEMDGKPVTGNLDISNFSTYPISMELQADLDLENLLLFYPVSTLKEPGGSLTLDVIIDGVLKPANGDSEIKASGQVDLTDVGFRWEKTPFPFRELNGNFLFNNEDIAISDFSGFWGQSDFMINGFLNNILQKLVDKDSPFSVEAELNSNFIDLDEVLAMERKDQQDSLFQFRIPAEVGISFDCKVNRIKFRRFDSRNNYGRLEMAEQKADLKGVTFNIAGGKVDLDAEIDASHPDSVFVYSETSYDKINVDSIFYIFENFNQDFLVDEHLKGQVYAQVSSAFNFDKYLKVNKNSIVINSSFSIRNGELNNFEPMMRLAGYLNEEKLDHLLFSDLENQVLIKNSTIFLPEMEVRSNVTNISILGTHTFSQKIDYSLKVPLRRNIKPDKDEAFGAIKDDGTGRAMIFLTIRGTTEDYKIAYDTKAVGKKIVQDIKKEGQELRDAIRNKGVREEKTIELDDEEYFDFEEDSVGTEKN